MFSIDLLTLGLAITVIAILGGVIFINNRRSITGISFLLFSLVAIIYDLLNYFSYQTAVSHEAIWLIRGVIFSAVWYAYALFQLLYVFPDDYVVFPKAYKYILLPAVGLASVLTLTPWVFKEINGAPVIGEVARVHVGPAVPVFGLVAGGLVLSAFIMLARKVLNANVLEKRQLKLVLYGTIITYTLIIVFNLVLPLAFNTVTFVSFAPLFTVPFIFFTSYAIVKHHLLNIKVVATELITFSLWLLLLTRAILSTNLSDQIISWPIFGASVLVGLLLIRSVVREVETREKMEELAVQLEVANSELKKLDEAKSDFISIASHQLRTPLTIIKGYISMMREGTFGKLTKKVADPLDKVYISNERLINLVADLLDLSRMERGKMVYDMREVHLVPAVEGLITDFKIAAENKGLKYSWSKKVENDVVKADENKIRQIILNFIDNSIKYTPSGKVDVALVQEGNQLRFSVTDTGSGLTEEEANTLFQKFVRGQQEKKSHTEGLGLGLYVAKLIAEAHGGTLGATSPGKGKGSTFYLTIPLLDQTKEKVEEFASKI